MLVTLALSAFLAGVLFSSASQAALNLNVKATGGNNSSPLLYGLFYEEINYSGDGGIYAELIENRAFQGSPDFAHGVASAARTTYAYKPIGPVTIVVDSKNPLSPQLQYVLRVDVPAGTKGQVGFLNEGFWGISVKRQAYNASFYMKANYVGNVNVALQSKLNTQVFGTAAIPVNLQASQGFKQYYTTLTPTVDAPNVNNTFAVTFDATKVAGSSVYFDLVSVFPPTFKNRPNGLRPDIANVLNGVKAGYLRFPGGNNMEGQYPPYSYWWNNTVGPLKNRPGRLGVWGNENTDGLGLIEFMNWCTDMNLAPILAVWAGLYLSGQTTPQSNLPIYVQSTMDQLEFLMGPTSSKFGAMRASMGYPNPWKIRAVEIGNEDNLNGGTGSYNSYRFWAYYNAIKTKYPNLQIVSSTTALSNPPKGVWLDYHTYNRPDGIVNQFGIFDHSSRNNPVLVGEYAVIQPNLNGQGVNWGGPQIWYPTMYSSAAEAVFLLGLERNSDVVIGSSYGQLMQNINFGSKTVSITKWTADPAQTLRSVNYYVQQMFATNLGTQTLPVTATTETGASANFGPIYWAASHHSVTGKYFVKLANYNGTTPTQVTITVPGSATQATLTTLWNKNIYAANTVGNEMVKPVVQTVTRGSRGGFTFTMQLYMVAVLAV